MSINVVLNGQTYIIPEPGDNTWGQELTDYFVALGSGVLQKAGGTFTLTAEVNFGATYGLLAAYFKSRTAGASSTGFLRLARTDVISWENNAGGGTLPLGVDSSDRLTFDGNPIIPSTALTASRAVVTDASGVLSAATTTSTEIGYVHGLTSALQTQLDAKIATAGHSALSVIGRAANSSGDAADIAAGTDNFVLRRSGTTLGFGTLVNANIDAAAAIDFSKLASLTAAYLLVGSAGNVATAVAMSGDTTISNAGVVAIGANKVTDAMLRTSAGLSIIGRSANTTGNVADITAGTDAFVLRRSGTTLGFGLLAAANLDPAAGIAFSQLAALSSGNILVGNVSNVAVSVSMSGDVTITNAGVTAIGTNKVTLAQLAQVATATFHGRTTAGTGNVEALTVTQATALLNNFVGDSGSGGTKGLVPAPASGDAAALKFLKADGTWAAPAGAGDVVGPGSAHDGGLVLFNGTTGKLIKESTITQHNVITSGATGTLSSVAPGTARNVLISDATDWTSRAIVNADLSSIGVATSFTPTIAGFGTVSAVNCFWQQIGKAVHIYGSFRAGTVASSTASIDISGVVTIDSTKYANTAVQRLGIWAQIRTAAGPASSPNWAVFYDGSDTAKVYLNDTSTGSNVNTKQNGNALIANSDSVSFDFWVSVT